MIFYIVKGNLRMLEDDKLIFKVVWKMLKCVEDDNI
jgi:hypothetical protein